MNDAIAPSMVHNINIRAVQKFNSLSFRNALSPVRNSEREYWELRDPSNFCTALIVSGRCGEADGLALGRFEIQKVLAYSLDQGLFND